MFDVTSALGSHRWPLVRISAHGKTSVTLCSDRFLPLSVHWVGRSIVCCGPSCPLCQVLPQRGLFYAAVSLAGRASILELGSLSASLLEQHMKLLHGGFRPGHEIELTRSSAKAPVRSEVISTKTGVTCVPLMMLVARVVALYHLPGPNPDEDFADYEKRLVHMCAIRCERERTAWENKKEKAC